MTDRYEDEPTENTPPPLAETQKARPRWVVPLIVGAAALLLGIGIGYGVGSSNDSEDDSSAATPTSEGSAAEEPAAEEEIEEPAYVPTVDDFAVELSVKERACFGGAGCNVTYKVKPTYEGIDTPEGTWDITYEVVGVEDGPVIETITLKDDQLEFTPELSVGTTGPKAKVRARITNVEEGY